LVDGVFVGLDSIDVGYGKSTPIGFANLNIFEPVRLLSVWRLSIALLRVFGLRLHTSIRRRAYGIARTPILVGCRMDPVSVIHAFFYGFGHGRVKRDNCLLSYSIGHRTAPRAETASEAVNHQFRETFNADV
jgi:hypothetical protein